LGDWRLYLGEQVPDVPNLTRFRSYDELLEEADEARDPELHFLVQVIAHHGRALPGLVEDLRRRATPHPAATQRVLSTAHKTKGLEWPRVRLAGDFPSLDELHALDRDGLPHLTPEERDQELHLLYPGLAGSATPDRLTIPLPIASSKETVSPPASTTAAAGPPAFNPALGYINADSPVLRDFSHGLLDLSSARRWAWDHAPVD
jgi:hypothetical protein